MATGNGPFDGMPQNNVIRHLPSREGQGGDASAPSSQQRLASQSPELPLITSDIQDLDPDPLSQTAVTGGLQRFPLSGSSQSPESISYGSRTALQTQAQQALDSSRFYSSTQSRHESARSAPTPGRSRIEVVLNVSPYKHRPREGLYDNVDELDGGLVTSHLVPKKRVSPNHERAPTLLASRKSTTATSTAPVTPAPPGQTGKRPRGRPKGWRPGMPSTKTGLLTASAYKHLDKDGNPLRAPTPAPKSTGQKRRGRPRRAPSPTPRGVWERLVAPPRYVPFLCEWPDCKAELQNIETLRKHVRTVHGRADPLVCRWARCGRLGEPLTFIQDYEFQDHVDEKHLVPLVWHVGDGYRNVECTVKPEHDPETTPAYLLGPNGEQVTPSVKNQAVEDFVAWREKRRRLKEIMLQRDANAPFVDEGEGEGEDAEAVPPT